MNTIYILILIIGGTSSQSGLTNVVQEFSSQQACVTALNDIISQWKQYNNSPIKYRGCYAKETK